MKVLLWIVIAMTIAISVLEHTTRGVHPLLSLSNATILELAIGAAVVVCVAGFGMILLSVFKLLVSPRPSGETQRVRPALMTGNKYVLWGVGLLLGLQIIAFTADIGLGAVNTYRVDSAIQHHGQRISAAVLQTYQDNCTNHGCGIYVQYQFKPFSPGPTAAIAPVQGTALIGNTNNSDISNFNYASATHTVPVAYDLDNPQWSALNFGNTIFTTDHATKMEITIAVLLGLYLLIGGVVVWAIMKRRRLTTERTA